MNINGNSKEMATQVTDCKSVYSGSIPDEASIPFLKYKSKDAKYARRERRAQNAQAQKRVHALPAGSSSVRGVIYFIRCGDFVKIGYAKNPKQRLAALQVGNPHDLELIGTLPLAPGRELMLHHLLQDHHHRGEWFRWNETVQKMIDASVRRKYRPPCAKCDEAAADYRRWVLAYPVVCPEMARDKPIPSIPAKRCGSCGAHLKDHLSIGNQPMAVGS